MRLMRQRKSPNSGNMAEKPSGGGDMPHRIDVEESMRERSSAGEGSEDIHELRKYIMQMMHSEMELMESVKQNEDSISTVNARIDKLKELIANEKHRSKQAELLLLGSLHELKALTDKKIVAEAKYRQYCETIAQRDAECTDLKEKYQHLRRAIQTLETQASISDRTIETTVSATHEVKEKLEAVIAASHDDDEHELRRAELQKIRAKKRYIDQHAEQIANEAKSLHDEHEQLHEKMGVASGELLDVDTTLQRLDADSAHQRSRLLEEIRRLQSLKEQSTKKLVTKQKKYRVKMKGEISTLKKRVTFVTRELEGHETGVEDIISSLSPFQDSRGLLESRLSELEAEIARLQESIRIEREQIDNFDGSKDTFDLSAMKSELEAKNVEVEKAIRNLAALEDELARLKEQDARILEEVHRVEEQIACASSAEVEEELVRANEELKELEEQRSSLMGERERVQAMCGRMSAQAQKDREQLKRAKSSTVKHQKELRKVTQQHEQVKARLVKEQEALGAVNEAEQLASRLNATLSEERAVNEARLKELEETLSKEGCEWKRQCLEEEARLKAELQEWDEKVQELQALLV